MVDNLLNVGQQDQQWIRASDEVVRDRLSSELHRLQSAASSSEVIGADAEDARVAYLSLTKTYHPSRFARRPSEIRILAGEVFMLIKEAYESSIQEANSKRLDEAKTQATGKNKARQRPVSSRPPDNSPARQEMVERRRAKLKNRLGASSNTGKRTAQIRTATDTIAPSQDAQRDDEEQRFERAVNLLKRSDFTAAATSFKELAVGRPADKKYRMHMHYAQGRVQQALGQADEARAEYKRALGLDADFSAAHQAMASLPDEHKKKSLLTKIFGK